jgi:hypothetical protein
MALFIKSCEQHLDLAQQSSNGEGQQANIAPGLRCCTVNIASALSQLCLYSREIVPLTGDVMPLNLARPCAKSKALPHTEVLRAITALIKDRGNANIWDAIYLSLPSLCNGRMTVGVLNEIAIQCQFRVAVLSVTHAVPRLRT